MAFDIKEKIEDLVDKIKKDKNLKKKFEKDPISALEGLIGIDLPDGQLEKVVDGIKAKLAADSIGDAIGGLFKKKK